jgi:UDP-N-acetylmuramoyl-L-alanyl-D-glutamate--2,6-diaminopimelate ligase
MKLAELIDGLPVRATRGDTDVEITDIAFDSRRVGAGALFVCVVGSTSDGHDHAAGAVEAGAAALIVERELDLDVPQVVVPDARMAMAPLAARVFADPSAELQVAAITGTNGKTTTAFLLRSILESAGIRCGLLGTVKQVVGGVEEEVERTTPEAIDLQRTFRRMLDAGDRACAIEVSSHALVLGRADATRFAAAAFTNLTQDHLDFHADMDDYFAAKRSLFFGEPGRREPPLRSVVNLDDPYGARLAAELRRAGHDPITFSADAEGPAEPTLRAEDISFDADGSRFTLLTGAERIAVELALPGDFNVANAMTALGLAIALGIDPNEAAAALREAEPVPGRMEPVGGGPGFGVLVDYAHTPDSLENVLAAARRLTEGRLIAVFGCGGDRDRAKRPLMGRFGSELADLPILTSDNPRSEDPAAIIADVLEGVSDRERVIVEPDRRAAIARAFSEAGPGDLVVIAGKGHEQGQEFEDGRKIPFDDREVAREELARLGGAEPAVGSPR